jgi:hypothetical protein
MGQEKKLCGENVELLKVPKLVVRRVNIGIIGVNNSCLNFVLFCRHYTKRTFRIEERPKIVPMFTRSAVICSVSSKYSYIKPLATTIAMHVCCSGRVINITYFELCL